MNYIRSQRYNTPQFTEKMMGPNPIKLTEELMLENRTPAGAVVCDLGSGQGITSAFLAQEYGFQVYACDLWSEPAENQAFFDQLGLTREQLIPVKADALSLPFEPAFFDAVVSVDSYNYFGRDPDFLGQKLLPYVKPGGCLYFAIPGMKQDCHDHLPPRAAPVLDAGTAGVYARRGLLETHDLPDRRHRSFVRGGDGEQRGSVAGLAETGERVRHRRPEKHERWRGKVPEFHPDRAEKALKT